MDSTGDSTLYIAHKNAQIILVKILSSSQANDKLIRTPIKATHRETSLRGHKKMISHNLSTAQNDLFS